MKTVTIHLGSATPHYFDVVRKHQTKEAGKAFVRLQNAATRKRYPDAYPTYALAQMDDENRLYDMRGKPMLARDGRHKEARR
jgi:hypothetical protein